ncbi:MAG: hypothetical protein ACREBV_10515, partial [Candidatus Zixiibacteriota bacterium]
MENQKLKYLLTAAVLGLGWFVVLFIPSMTRNWLIENTFLNIVFLVIASVLIARLGRRYIGRAESFGGHLVRATLLPYLGTFIFLTIWNIQIWGKTLLFGGLANLHDSFSLYYMGLIAVTVSLYVVIPYGLFCQYTMQG